MAGQPTANVDLYTTNMQTDGEDYFDFERDLDNNWEKLDKRFGCIDVAILPNNWVGTQAPYSQTITVEGMTAKFNPTATLNASAEYETATAEREEMAKILNGKTEDGSVTFYAKNPTSIPLNIKLRLS